MDFSQSHECHQQTGLISIPQLSPDLPDADRYSFQAVVTLVWPYSSSNRLFSLLLADRDFRLRNQNGQIRVTFCGLCAEEVALTKVGIGDTVTLSLQGAQWTENKNIQWTPGKSLSWELQFKNRLKFEASRNGEKIAALDIDRPSSPRENAEPSTPEFNDGFATPDRYEEKWETPAFLRTKRIISRSPLYSEFNLFAEEDGYIPGRGRKRPRFSIPSSEWRLVNEADSFAEEPHKDNDDWFESDEEKLNHDDEEAKTSVETVSHTIPAGGALGGDMQLAESETHIMPANNTSKIVQSIMTSPDEAVIQSSLQNASLSSETPHLNHLVSPDPATLSPIVSTPVEDLRHPYDLHSNSVLTHSLGDSEHSTIAPDAYNAEPWDSAEMHDTNTQVQNTGSVDIQSNMRSQYSEQTTSTSISHHGSPGQSSPLAAASEPPVLHAERSGASSTNEAYPSEPPDYHGSNGENLMGENVDIVESESEGRLHIYETAIDADTPRDIQEVEEDDDEGLEQSSGYLTSHPNLNAERGIDHSSQHLESEDIIYEERRANVQRTEAENLHHGHYRNVTRDTEDDEAELDETDFSDDAEKDPEEVMSVEFETDSGSEAESAHELYEEPVSEPEVLQRIVHPEVIVIDSDSDDEPSRSNAPPAMQETIYPYDECMQEEGDESSDAEDQDEERDADAIQSDADPYDYDHSHEDLPVQDAYLSNEETSSSNNIQESEDDDAYFGHFPTEQSNVDSLDRLSGAGAGHGTVHSDTARTSSPLDASSARLTPDNQLGVGEEQRQTHSPGDEAAFAKGNENDASIKKDQSFTSDGRAFGQEHYLSSTRNTQRLVYRTATPKPVPTPPSTLDDEPLCATSGIETHVSADHGSPPSASNVVGFDNPVDTRRHRWTDGLDEGIPEMPDSRSLDDEFATHDIPDENNVALDKYDEVVLVENHSMQPSLDLRRQPRNSEKQDDLPVRDLKVYPTLATLAGYLNKMIDTISVVVDISPAEPAMPASGEYRTRLRITDISMAGATVVVDIAQPYETSISAVTEGDIIMLYNFEVQSLDGSLKLLGVDGSDWVIFRDVADKSRVTNTMMTFCEREHAYAKMLQNWYREHGAAMAADHMLQLSISQEDRQPSPFTAASSSDAGSLDWRTNASASRPRARRKKSHRRITIHELRDGRRYTDVGPQGSDLIHELRDGTVYAHSFED